MFEILITLLFLWLMFQCIGLVFKLTWGAAKIAAGILMVLSLPALVLCLIFAGGIFLLVPIVLIVLAAVILRACVNG